MPEQVKVVVHFSNHRIVKGYTQDFFPNKPLFHLHPAEAASSREPFEIALKELKAIFFVKDFQGNPGYQDKKEFIAKEQSSGRKVEITFIDGEILFGTTLGYDPKRVGFFVFPADPGSNNLRVFAISTAVRNVRYV
jgi:hypothetical protein